MSGKVYISFAWDYQCFAESVGHNNNINLCKRTQIAPLI